MKKIQRIKQSNSFNPIKSFSNSKMTSLAKRVTQERKQITQESKLTIAQLVEQLKTLTKIFSVNGIRIIDIKKYEDKKRIDRAKKQLKVYFLNSFKKGKFRFVVKASGLNPPNVSYYVDIQFKDLDDLIYTKKSYDEILNESAIRTQCTCDDFRYRFRYWLTKMGAVLGYEEHRFPKITNPHSEHKFLCKHQILVINGIQKPSFVNGIFKRYIDNLRQGKSQVRTTEKDKFSTFIASHKVKIKD